MARLFRFQINVIRDHSNSEFKDIVSPVGAYDISELLTMASKNQQLPSLHTYSFQKSPIDLDNPLPKVTNLVQYFGLVKQNDQNIKDIQSKMDADAKAKAEQAQKDHDAQVIANYVASQKSE